MRKSKILMAVGLSAMMAFAGCGSTSSTKEYSDYVELGEYKGIEVTVTPVEVTDKEVQDAINTDLKNAATDKEVTDRAVESGDKVNINYVGKIDGKEFEGGSAEKYDLTIGSGSFIEGFEDQLIGANKGDTVTVKVTFPKDYSNKDVAGKDAEFTVTINKISETEVPKFTDKWVKSTSEEYKTTAEYEKGKKAELLKAKEDQAETTKKADVLTTIVENSKISGYPQKEIDDYIADMKSYYESYASYFGMDFATLLEQGFNGMTEEEFNEEAKTLAEQTIAREMICALIAEKEGIKISDKEYEEGLKKYTSDYGYKTEDEFLEDYSEDVVKKNLTYEKVLDFISENAVEVEGKANDSTTEKADDKAADSSAAETTEGSTTK